MSAAGTLTVGKMIQDAAGTPTQIGQMISTSEGRGVRVVRHGHGGKLSPSHASIHGYAPRIPFAGTGIKMLLDIFGLKAYDLGTSGQDITVYMKEYLQGGSVKATGEKLVVSKGLGMLLNIEAAHGSEPAACGGVLMPDSADGSTDPIVRTADQAIVADSFTQNVFGMGKVTLNSTDVTGLLGWSLDLGNVESRRSADSDLYITHSSLVGHAPALTLTLLDVKQFLTDFAKSGQAADLVFYLRHMALGASWTLDATASHIKFTGVEGTFHLDEQNVSHAADGSGTVAINLSEDSSGTTPLAVNTASAIT